jgi:hypothetical protein
MIGWLLGSLAAVAGIWLVVKVERWRIAAETAREVERLDAVVLEARSEVAGMSEDELDEMVYGPRDDDTPVPAAVGLRGDPGDRRSG